MDNVLKAWLAVLLLAGTVSVQAQPSGLAGYWRFDEGSGVDASGQGAAAQLVGPVAFSAGRVGQALSLSGSGAYARLSASDAASGRTRAAWVLARAAGGNRGLVSSSDWVTGSLHFKLDGSRLVADLRGGTTLSAAFGLDAWHHVAVTYDPASGAFRLFIDGAVVASATTRTGLVIQGEDFIGNEYTDGRYFVGLIDEVRLYDRALSPAEVDGLYRGAAAVNQAPVVRLDRPAVGVSFTAPAEVVLEAVAEDVDGSVVRVEFYRGSELLATDTSAPYRYTWSSVGAGSYTVRARAVDNAGAAAEASAAFTVTAPVTQPANAIYVSPSGSSGANGTPQKPYTLSQALSAVSGTGKAVFLMDGVYPGPHNFKHSFNTASPVVVMPAPGAHAVIEGSFYRSGGGIRWQNIEFGVSGWTSRRSSQNGSAPSDIPDNDFNVLAKDQFINCIIHDHNSNGFWAASEDVLVYGTLFYNQGWQGPDRGHGHAAYMQNQTGTKQFKRNVFVSGFSGLTVHAYTEKGYLQGFNYEENVSIRGLWLVGGYAPVSRLTMTGNHIYGGLRLGYSNNVTSQDATLKNNVLLEPLATRGAWTALSETGTLPAAGMNRVFVYDNAYDTDRGLVVVYNAAKAGRLDVNLSSLPLTPGKRYRLLNSLNPNESHEFVYDGSVVSVPMNGWSVAVPVSWAATIVENTLPAFGAFLLAPAGNSSTAFNKTAGMEVASMESGILALEETPAAYSLGDNYPNPFNPTTMIPFSLPEAAHVRMAVYDVTGRQVASLLDERFVSGRHEVAFEGGLLPSGLYLVRMTASGGEIHHFTRKILLVK